MTITIGYSTVVSSYYRGACIIIFCMYSSWVIAQPKVYRNQTFDHNEQFLLRKEDSGTKFINCTFKNYNVASFVVAIDGATDILFDRCTFKNIKGVKVGNDTHAIACGRRGRRVTIKRSTFINVAADGIQMGHKGEDIRDWEIVDNEFINCGENGIDIKTVHGTVLVKKNSFSQHAGCPGGDLGCTGGSGIGMIVHYGARGIRIEENKFFNNEIGLGIFVSDGMLPKNIKVCNNFFYQNNKGLLIHRGKEISIYHNTFVSQSSRHMSITQNVGSWLSYKNNLLVGSGIPSKNYPGQGNMSIPEVKDAKFANASAHYYRLGSNSPAINAAVSIGAVTTDWEGDTRPQAGKFDVGADERVFETKPSTPPPSNGSPGLNYQYYHGSWKTLPNFSQLPLEQAGTQSNFNLKNRQRDNEFGFVFEGYVNIETGGTYTFYTTSDDGSQLFINTRKVVDNNGLHGKRERSGSVTLMAGWHPIRVLFFERYGGNVLEVRYQGPGISKRLIPDKALSTEDRDNTRYQQHATKSSYFEIAPEAEFDPFPKTEVTVFPNPARNLLYVSLFYNLSADVQVELHLCNSASQKVFTKTMSSQTLMIDLSKYSLSPGVYYLNIYRANHTSEVVKLLIE